MYRSLFIILIILFAACKSKQITTQTHEVTKIDTIYKFQDRIIDRPVIDSIVIEQPCDSLGQIKPFKGVLKTNHAKVSVTAENGRIAVQVNIDSLKTEWLKEYRSNNDHKTEIKEIEIIKYRWPWWVIYLIGYSVIITLWVIKRR